MNKNKRIGSWGLPESLRTRASWWERYQLLLAGALILTLSFAAMLAIWSNIQDMETKRGLEHEALARSIGETAKTFLVNRQYDYFLEIVKLIQKTPFIEHIAVLIEGRTAFQAGQAHALGGYFCHIFPLTHQVRKKLDYQNGKEAEMVITFSLEEFRRPQLFILGAFAVIIILLICLGWAGYWLYHIHRKLVLSEATKEHMIYSITHDAKQDLFVIQGKLSSLLPQLQNGSKPGNLQKDLKLTMESADSIERYLNNLKDQQGLAKGRVEMFRETVFMHEIIHSVADAFAEKMNMRRMAVQIGRLDQKQKVSADPQMLKRVLMNLIHNAMKYSPLGSAITIWQEVRPDGLYTYIRDQGQGIPPEDWLRIFQPYVQLNPKKEGMGLGLATARQLVELLDGRLEVVESIIGQGTTICLVLPLLDEQSVAAAGRENG